mmetsp:Transcript_9320/g.10486  ORF Transcript_9320/g.10486 Transcript_9320/m.10486 type:complete len:294 (-) Transcript_9320:161-1042(-)
MYTPNQSLDAKTIPPLKVNGLSNNTLSPVPTNTHKSTPGDSGLTKQTAPPLLDASIYWQESPHWNQGTPRDSGSTKDGKPAISLFQSQDRSPTNRSAFGAITEKQKNSLYMSHLIETNRLNPNKQPPAGYDPNKLYFQDPEIKKIAESSRKFHSLTWKEPNKQAEYFQILRETDLLDYKFYGHPEEVLELRLSMVSGIPPKKAKSTNSLSTMLKYSTVGDVKKELAQSSYIARIRNSNQIGRMKGDESQEDGIQRSFDLKSDRILNHEVDNRVSDTASHEGKLVKSQFVMNGQ